MAQEPVDVSQNLSAPEHLSPTPSQAQAPAPAPAATPAEHWQFADVLLIAVASILVLVAGTLGLAALKPDITLLALSLSALEAIALTISVYVLGIRRRGFTWEAVGLRPIRRGWTPVAVSLGVLCLWLTGIIATLVQ